LAKKIGQTFHELKIEISTKKRVVNAHGWIEIRRVDNDAIDTKRDDGGT